MEWGAVQCGRLVINDQITIGALGAFTEYANNIIWPMELVGWLSNDIAAAVASPKGEWQSYVIPCGF